MNGQEEYHGTLVGADGTPVPLYAEAQQIGREFAKAGPALAGTSVKSEVAMLHSYDSRWAIDWQRHNKNYDPAAELVSYYGPLRAVCQSIDVVEPVAPLSQYKLVVAPGTERALRCSGEESHRLCARRRAPGAGPALRHER